MVRTSNEGVSYPPFLVKCYEMVEDESTDSIISWSGNNDSFVISDMTVFERELLPRYFKHNNFSSFMRQLNIYGFRKIDSDRWEFANDGFIRGQKHLMKNITRRKQPNGSSQKSSSLPESPAIVIEEEEFLKLQKEVEALKTDKNALMQELVKLQQHQETSHNKMLLMGEHLKGMEKNQQQMLSLIVLAMQNPGLLVQLLQPMEGKWHMTEAGKNLLAQGDENGDILSTDRTMVKYQPIMNEKQKPLLPPVLDSEKFPEFEFSSELVNDLFKNVDFAKGLLDEKLLSSDNHVPLVLPDLPDDWMLLDQLLMTSTQLLENSKDEEPNTTNPQKTQMELDSTQCGNQLEKLQNPGHLNDYMKSQNLRTNPIPFGTQPDNSSGFLTVNMGPRDSEANC
ncbi:Heat shock factor (HSF)-type, DNA-binding [Dillenia turbinata]|uniref:Heat shock factor (HSF)-type, DNA-binding n=1 Tax=Dillenia turbinata TaxID=194707 RepID=A0AAN8Z5R1_9MAGN